MLTLANKFSQYGIAQLLYFADRLDPNNNWRESVADDPAMTCLQPRKMQGS